MLGDSVRSNGTSFVVNKYFGVAMNAAYSVSNTVTQHTTSLSNAMIGALSPAVTTAEGAGERSRTINLAFCTCKFGALLIMFFAIPLIIEMDEVLRLWLVEPPEYTATYCRCILFAVVIVKLGWGHHMAIYATGKIALYQFTMGIISFSTIFLIWGLVAAGLGALGVGLSFILSYSLLTGARVFFARRLVGMPFWYWLGRVAAPVVVTATCSFALGWGMLILMPPSFARVCLTSIVCCIVTLVLGYFLICNADERIYLRNGANRVWAKIGNR